MKKFIIINAGLYSLLTLPHITKMLFDKGIAYPFWLVGIIAIGIPIISTIFLQRNEIKKKTKNG